MWTESEQHSAYPLTFENCKILKTIAAVSEPKIEKCQILPNFAKSGLISRNSGLISKKSPGPQIQRILTFLNIFRIYMPLYVKSNWKKS